MTDEKTHYNYNTGGMFLLNPIGTTDVFSRENFTEEQSEIEKMTLDFAMERIYPNVEAIDKLDKDLSHSLLKEMGELGLLGVDVPEKYGGMELDKITMALVIENLTRGGSASLGTMINVQTSIGSLGIVWFGTPKQKEKYIPKLVTGEWIAAYGLTEPSAGSDAVSGKTKAVLSDDGKHYILNGEKCFISNGDWADVYTVLAQVDGNKFTAFIVDRDTEGFETGAEEKKMGMKGNSTTTLKFTNTKIPSENLLYEVGKGAAIAFNALNIGRFKLAAACLGGAKSVINQTLNYANERRQFGQTITNFDAIKSKIADMIIKTYAADSMIYRTIGLIQEAIDKLDSSADDYYIKMGNAMEKYAIEASMTKVFGSEVSGQVIDHALQILGGYGFIEEYRIAGAYRDDRINRIWEGTNEINRMIISGYMIKKILMEEIPFREEIAKTNSILDNGIPDWDSPYIDEALVVESAKRLAMELLHEALCEFGQDLKHEQMLTELIADILIDIFTTESTLVRVCNNQDSATHFDIIDAIAKVQTAEMSTRVISRSLTGFNRVFSGNIPENMKNKIDVLQNKMDLSMDVIFQKRHIAESVSQINSYPF
ncbi:MAG TPA: acyl-CoA dehydrogenase family protein [Candidatus Marinimicrobia bacterium]|nr:acyl-CoA dehydrogenase family protein [Candidatus Neomarinimicrobiota bacterium]|tara:strand:- start:2564 stop:4354 length:1791 start_codon:yes stop_codon:yes gene_type:complete